LLLLPPPPLPDIETNTHTTDAEIWGLNIALDIEEARSASLLKENAKLKQEIARLTALLHVTSTTASSSSTCNKNAPEPENAKKK